MDYMWIVKIFLCVFSLFNSCCGSHNITEWANLRRQKRTLIYQNSGVAKFVFGVITPMDLHDKKPWRQLNWSINLQAQYALPTDPTYWWDKWDGRTLARAKSEFEKYGNYVKDQSRRLLYATIELYMNRNGKNGKKCIQRAICENAEIDVSDGVFAEIIHLAFNPTGDDSVDSEYHEAFKAGRFGALCHTLYPECPFGEGLLDSIAVTKKIEF